MKKKYIVDELIAFDPYVLPKEKKEKLFKEALLEEIQFHYQKNAQYQQFCQNKKFDRSLD